MLFVVVLGYYWWLQHGHSREEAGRTSAFIALVVGQLSLAVADGSPAGRLFSREHLAFWLIVAAAGALLGASLTVPLLLHLLRFAAPTVTSFLVSGTIGMVAGGWSAVLLRSRLRTRMRDAVPVR